MTISIKDGHEQLNHFIVYNQELFYVIQQNCSHKNRQLVFLKLEPVHYMGLVHNA